MMLNTISFYRNLRHEVVKIVPKVTRIIILKFDDMTLIYT